MSEYNEKQWWDLDTPHDSLSKLINQMYNDNDRDSSYRLFTKLYLGATSEAWSWTMIDNFQPTSSGVGYNLIRSCVDTVVNRIGKMTTVPSFVTNDGTWGMRKKAEKLDAYVNTQIKAHRYQSNKRLAFRDACIYGDGFVKFYNRGDNVFFERIHPLEMMVDRAEGMYGETDKLYQIKGVSRSKAIAMFPKNKKQLMTAPQVPAARTYYHNSKSDIIEVYEAWKLPYWEMIDGEIKILEKGRHVIATSNATLLDEEFEMIRFPFIHFQWLPKPFGFFGTGIAEQLFGTHIEVNKLLSDVQQNMYFNSAPFWFLQNGGEVLKTRISNEIGRVVEGNVPPQLYTFATTQPEIFQHIQWLIQSGMNEVGISQLASQSQKPAGLDSGKALREFDDIESERFVTVGQQIEEQTVEAAHIIVDLTKEKFKDNKKLKVKYKDKNIIHEIKWADIDLERDKYAIECLPKSALSNTFAGRINDAKDLLELGVIDNNTVADLFDFPDVKGVSTLSQAARNYVKDAFEKIIETGELTEPVPSMDLKFAVKYSTLMIDKLLTEGFNDEAKLETMRTFTQQAQDLLDQASQAQMALAQGQMMQQQTNPVTGSGDLAPVMGQVPAAQ